MKEKDNTQIIMDFAKAWETLNPELIIENLDETFVYDSQWVLESLTTKDIQNIFEQSLRQYRIPVLLLQLRLYMMGTMEA